MPPETVRGQVTTGPRFRLVSRLARLLAPLREFHATQLELQQRRWLLNQPWEEEFLHWAYDGEHGKLHGQVLPPPDGKRHSVTSSGWCPGIRRARDE
jgi:hypothetical protein